MSHIDARRKKYDYCAHTNNQSVIVDFSFDDVDAFM